MTAPRTFRPRECVACSRTFVPTGGRSRRCPACRAARAVERELTPRAHHRRTEAA